MFDLKLFSRIICINLNFNISTLCIWRWSYFILWNWWLSLLVFSAGCSCICIFIAACSIRGVHYLEMFLFYLWSLNLLQWWILIFYWSWISFYFIQFWTFGGRDNIWWFFIRRRGFKRSTYIPNFNTSVNTIALLNIRVFYKFEPSFHSLPI